MSVHPALLMVATWAIAAAVFFILPFELIGRDVTFYGFAVLTGFLFAFVIPSLLAARPVEQCALRRDQVIDWTWSDRVLRGASLISLVALAIELSRRNFLDLGASFLERESRSSGVIEGVVTDASLAFQIAFFFYPAAIVLIARIVGFDRKIGVVDLLVFGIAPTLGISLALGGRSPVFFALVIAVLALGIRRRLLGIDVFKNVRNRSPLFYIVLGALSVVAMGYFNSVFLARAEQVGGLSASFDNAALNWGIAIEPAWFAFLTGAIGEANTYTVFLLSWYLLQGLIMSNLIFTDYQGSLGLGVYSIDLIAAVARRVDQDFASRAIIELYRMNIAGFLPSAFGSLFVDLAFYALLPVAIWGYLAGLIYRKIREASDNRWLIFAPFVTFGIVFSIVNTPLGFSNGLMVHAWLILAFLLSRTRPAGANAG